MLLALARCRRGAISLGARPRSLFSSTLFDEDDLDEKFIHGGGNGGQKVGAASRAPTPHADCLSSRSTRRPAAYSSSTRSGMSSPPDVRCC